MKHRNIETNIRYLFFALQGILYGLFLFLDIAGWNASLSSRIKFVVIMLCLLYTLLKQDTVHDWKRLCIRSAFLFTLIADYFLLLMDRHHFYGVLSFIIVQQIYGVKLDLHMMTNRVVERKQLVLPVLRRLGLQMAAAVLVCMMLNNGGVIIDRILFASLVYIISFVSNVIWAFKVARQHPLERGNFMFAIGLILFLLCDINVGLFNLSDYLSLTLSAEGTLYNFSSILMWAFYAPSQVLIALSIRDYRQNV